MIFARRVFEIGHCGRVLRYVLLRDALRNLSLEPSAGCRAVNASRPHGIGSAARMTAVRRFHEASMYDSNRWDGFELRPGDCNQSSRRCRTSVEPADDLRPAHTAGTGAPAPVGHALAVDRHGDSRPHRRVRGPGSPDAPPGHQDPHAARRDTQRSDGHVHAASGGTRATWGCRWTTISTCADIGAFLNQRERAYAGRRYRARTIATTAAARPTASVDRSGSGRRRDAVDAGQIVAAARCKSTCRRSRRPPTISAWCICTTTT